ncbi:hypothetical protein HD554DRAFT_1292774 [Boletus coccyginus]|nr:hypothetical protein HD554DRAFT_1292774 [Boletus coccyginus]
MHKRKHRKSNRDEEQEYESAHTSTATSHVQSTFSPESLDAPTPDPCLYIQAHEADVIRGPPAVSAHFLECQDPTVPVITGNNSRSGLIRWGPPEHSGDANTVDIKRPLLWVDRYDVRLLLDHLPDFQSDSIQLRPLSPSGWSDLPSDSEDTFFFSPDELEDYRREKRRRLIDRSREERLRALATIDGQEEDLDPWGGSDEERELIRRTASHIISSPNPAQLEMRILANHGIDKRFAFLRGRWSRVWRTEKERVKQHQAEETKKVQLPTALTSFGGLAGYGDSDTDGEGGLPDVALNNPSQSVYLYLPGCVRHSTTMFECTLYFITLRVEEFLDENT